jgi:predicted transcriptional regulator
MEIDRRVPHISLLRCGFQRQRQSNIFSHSPAKGAREYTFVRGTVMPITLQNPDLDQKLRSLAAETGTSPEALAEETLTSYFAAAADLGDVFEQRLREVEQGKVETVDGEQAFARLKKRKRSMQ